MMELGAQVSVIIPFKGRIDLLIETLDSVRAQTFANWEVLAVDDGAPPEDIRTIADRFGHDKRIRVIHRQAPPPGANHCRNLGLRAASAPYVIFLDSDDLLAPHCLTSRVAAIERRPELGFLVFRHHHFRITPGDMDKPFPISREESHLDRYTEMRVPWQTAGPIWRREPALALGWDEALPRFQDWDFYVRALATPVAYDIANADPDLFHRLPVGRVSISNSTGEKASLEAAEFAFTKGASLLSSKGLLTPHRAKELSYRLRQACDDWIRLGSPERGRAIWLKTRRLSLISVRAYWTGRIRMLLWDLRARKSAWDTLK